MPSRQSYFLPAVGFMAHGSFQNYALGWDDLQGPQYDLTWLFPISRHPAINERKAAVSGSHNSRGWR